MQSKAFLCAIKVVCAVRTVPLLFKHTLHAYYVMAHYHWHRRYRTLQQALEEVANSSASDEEEIVNLPPEQGDSCAFDVEKEDEDVSHKHNDKENEVASNSQVFKLKEKHRSYHHKDGK